MGSVKDLEIIRKPTKEEAGIGRFIFSDRYSVFDWGEMPDYIENKGKALCIVGAYFLEKLEKEGIKTHYRGVVQNSTVKKLSELKEPTNIMEINLLRVLKPKLKNNNYDYSIYKNETGNFLIPLEIIYRNYLTSASSLYKRIISGLVKKEELGLNEIDSLPVKLPKTYFDVSTKLERSDRYLSWEEAKEIVSLSEKELNEIKNITSKIEKIITSEVEKIGLINEDGKIELGFDSKRSFIVVDILGTPDECRFTFENIPVSKEALRIYYRKTSWFNEIENAKKIDKINWKEYVKIEPPKLPKNLKEIISNIYQSLCNEITENKWFNVPDFKICLNELKSIISKYQ